MASIYLRKDSPYFWMSYRLPNGDWRNKSTGIRTDVAGGRRRAEVKAHLESARETDLRAGASGKRLAAWVPEFLKQRYELRQPKTYLRYTQAWTALRVFLDERGAITAGQVSRHLAKSYPLWRVGRHKALKAVKWNSAIFELKVLGSILQDAVEREEIAGNPCYKLGLKRERPKEKEPISLEDQSAIEAKLEDPETPEWMRVSWAIMIKQGCRISETGVPLDRVDLAAQTPTITFQTKGNRLHTAPLHPDLVPLLRRLKEAKAAVTCVLPPNAARTWHNFIQRKLGLKQYSIHSARVTVVTRLAAANFSQPMIKDYVGHASTTVNDVYRKLRARDLAGMSGPLSSAAGAAGRGTTDSP